MPGDSFAQSGAISDVPLSISGNGDNQIVAAAAGKQYKLLSLVAVAGGTVSLTLKSDLAGSAVAKTGAMPLVANGQLILPLNPDGWVTTDVGKALNFGLSGAVAVTGVAKIQTIG